MSWVFVPRCPPSTECASEDLDVVLSFSCTAGTGTARTITRRPFRDHEYQAPDADPHKQLQADFRRCFFQDTVSGERPSLLSLRCIVSGSCCPHKMSASMTQTGMVPAITYLVHRYPNEHIGEVRDNRGFPMFVKMFSWNGVTVVQASKRVRSFVVDPEGNDTTRRLFNVIVVHIGYPRDHRARCRCKTTFSVQEYAPNVTPP